jgi:hypothetical protein
MRLSAVISSILTEAHGISFDEIVELAETRLQRSLNKNTVSTCLQNLNAQYDQRSDKWILVPADEQVLDEEDIIEGSSSLDQSPPVLNSILKVPFPFLSGL